MIKNKIIFSLILMLFLNSCGGFSDAGKVLRNEKINTTDEFLVKKREPLTLPPEYKELPTPGSIKKNKKDNKSEVSKILQIEEENNTPKKSSSVEQSIINQINK